MTVNDSVEWTHVTRPKVRQTFETDSGGLAGQSFESFYYDCILGELAYCTPGTSIRLHWDADLSTATEYAIEGMEDWKPDLPVAGWSSLMRVALPRLIKVP